MTVQKSGDVIVITPYFFWRLRNFAVAAVCGCFVLGAVVFLYTLLFVRWEGLYAFISALCSLCCFVGGVWIGVVALSTKVQITPDVLIYSSWLFNARVPRDQVAGFYIRTIWLVTFYPTVTAVSYRDGDKYRHLNFTSVQFSKKQVRDIYELIEQWMKEDHKNKKLD